MNVSNFRIEKKNALYGPRTNACPPKEKKRKEETKTLKAFSLQLEACLDASFLLQEYNGLPLWKIHPAGTCPPISQKLTQKEI